MIDLRDCTFIIPFKATSQDRLDNLDIVMSYITSNIKTNILLGEQDSQERVRGRYPVNYHFFESDKFHRTRILNFLLLAAKTKFIINCDADVLLPSSSYAEALSLLRENRMDIVYPYKRVADIINKRALNLFEEKNVELRSKRNTACGGTFIISKRAYKNFGMENENFLNWGGEDIERLHRFSVLGARIGRCGDFYYHLRHALLWDGKRGFFREGRVELKKVRSMNKEQQEDYIKTWLWLRRM